MVSFIVAIARNGVIGRDGALPWRLPDESRHFRRTTLGKAVVMGRRTWEEIGCKPLDGRRTVVVSRTPGFEAPGAEVVPDLKTALELTRDEPETVVAGGARLYAAVFPVAERAYVTWVDAAVDGDTRFPEVDWSAFREVEAVEHPADARHAHAFRISTLERVRA